MRCKVKEKYFLVHSTKAYWVGILYIYAFLTIEVDGITACFTPRSD